MNYFLKSLMLVAWGMFMANSCKPKEDPLPAPTTEGLNTFGCRINGKVWIANGIRNDQGPAAKAIEVEFKRLSASTFYLMIHTNASTKDRVQLSLPKGVIGTNRLKNLYDDPFAVYYDNQFRLFTSMESNPGKVVISRLDTINHIVSGTFEFDGQFIVNKEIVRVTEGRFDIDMDNL
ncbi:hypothetical protein IC229_14395 [Spirosoma sp. BT702]|uniref:Uncharacterized protein n=1 Tax=Spirosoma profusum TaxID=2771354 RepID=A0A926Y1H6_9BACT|nr:DUF6252 family protein [Spirosoma profusum]MBD2701838.1 hypothetical protein [Spirosoma profusum]